MSFNEFTSNKRKVDLSGSKDRTDRKQILDKAAQQRAQRQAEKDRLHAAIVIQARYRSHRSRVIVAQHLRKAFDARLSSQTKDSIKALLQNETFSQFLSEFLFFYNRHAAHAKGSPLPARTDAQRANDMLKLIMASFSAVDPAMNILSCSALDDQRFNAWLRLSKQIGKLCIRLLPHSLSSQGIPAPLSVLWYLTDTTRWPFLASVPLADRDRINQFVAAVSQHLMAQGLFTTIRGILQTSLPLEAPIQESHKALSTICLATAFNICRHLSRTPAAAAYWTARPGIEYKVSNIPPGNSVNVSFNPVNLAPFPALALGPLNFVAQILSLPLLVERLLAHGLGSLADRWAADPAWSAVLEATALCAVVPPSSIPFPNAAITYTAFDSVMLAPSGPSAMDTDDDSDSEQKVDAATKGPNSPFAWIFGNLLMLGHRVPTMAVSTGYAAALSVVAQRMPRNDFPSSKAHVLLHPTYEKEIDIFRDLSFCEQFIGALREPNTSSHDIAIVCTLLDTVMYRSGSTNILDRLVFTTPLVPRVWEAISRTGVISRIVQDPSCPERSIVTAFCTFYSRLLQVQDDHDIYELQQPFSLAELRSMVQQFRSLLYTLYWSMESIVCLDEQLLRLRDMVTEAFRKLRERHSRRPFCGSDEWLITEVGNNFDQEFRQKRPRTMAIMRNIPFVIPFRDRVAMLSQLINADKEELLGAYGAVSIVASVTVNRAHILEDGFRHLHPLGATLKGRVRIQFVDEFGNNEAGVDGGGLFKEFLVTLLKKAFDPAAGLFAETTEHFLYPNPDVDLLPDYATSLQYYQFLGLVVGKALYESVVLEPQFANFFLRKLLGEHNFVDDLLTLDPELYRHVMWLKKYTGPLDGFGLTFSVDRRRFDQTLTQELVPNGANTPVTQENKLRFVSLLALHKLHRQIRAQSDAFIRGMQLIVPRDWLRMFTADELNLLLSGQRGIDLNDLRRHIVYSNGYNANHEVIKWFWSFLDSCSPDEQAQFLKFVTSCSRAPLLGFESLDPKLCIQRTNGSTEDLPTSSTCMNLLRLPRYATEAELRTKLRLAFQHGSDSFQLS